MTLQDWFETANLRTDRRWPLTLAFLFLVLYVAAVVLGSVVQSALKLPLQMGWLQQLFAVVFSLLFAFLARDFSSLLGLERPRNGWLMASLIVGASISLAGTIGAYVGSIEPSGTSTEWFLYQATAPGFGEELGLRGVFLSLLAIGLARFDLFSERPVLVLILASTPFALLHLLELTGLKLMVVLVVTLYAGVVLGWLRLRHASIWPAILAHNVANVVSGMIDMARLSAS